jgi:hypothetical protein
MLIGKLTRNDLEMMLEEMDKNNADNIELDVGIIGREWEFNYLDFDIYYDATQHGKPTYVKTVLTLE